MAQQRATHGTHGLHHVTAISGPAQENLDFYAGVLGMKLVKKSVNQDDPGTYHLFYADAEGRPGTDLTFFPWAQMAPSRPGHGLATEVALAVPRASLAFWADRLERYGAAVGARERRFGDEVLPLVDPDGERGDGAGAPPPARALRALCEVEPGAGGGWPAAGFCSATPAH
ncbi:MAG: glyoxalase family protein, partial [Acidobacteriota bacterium]|nr:glyoxalase family protein [Acidobacteriota bacterium]